MRRSRYIEVTKDLKATAMKKVSRGIFQYRYQSCILPHGTLTVMQSPPIQVFSIFNLYRVSSRNPNHNLLQISHTDIRRNLATRLCSFACHVRRFWSCRAFPLFYKTRYFPHRNGRRNAPFPCLPQNIRQRLLRLRMRIRFPNTFVQNPAKFARAVFKINAHGANMLAFI